MKKELETKLVKYGFPDIYIKDIMKGKKVNVIYGTVQLDRKTNILKTFYKNGETKEEKL